jgi:glycosyltransferase involved in cell wall biosynthesis
MNIGIDAHMLGHNETGNETYVLELVRALARHAYDDTYFIYVEQPARLPPEIRAAPHVRVIPYATRSSVRRLLDELPKRAARDALDVLHMSYNAPLRLPNPCALVVTIHDISFEHFPQFFSRRLRAFLKTSVPRSARAATHILTDTESAKCDLVRTYHLPAEKITVTPYAAGAQFRPVHDRAALDAIRQKYNTGEHYILAVGNLQPRKNHLRLLQAFAQAKQMGALPHKLVIVGQSWWRAETVYAHARAFGDAVQFTGYVPDADLPLLYNAANVFCYPSLYEGFGLPVLEAMACGVPVITSNLSALPEVAGDAARLVDPYDTNALAHALYETAADDALRQELRRRGLARAQLFTWARTAEQTHRVYQRAARRLTTAQAPR